MTSWMFDAPGGLKDFREPSNWHAAMQREARDIVILLIASALDKSPDDLTDDDLASARETIAYVDPTVTVVPAGAQTVPVQAWNGFPRAVSRRAPWKEFPQIEGDLDGRFRAVEHLGDEDHPDGVFVDRHDRLLHLPVRDRQDEYLEWAIRRDGDGKIVKLA